MVRMVTLTSDKRNIAPERIEEVSGRRARAGGSGAVVVDLWSQEVKKRWATAI